MGYDDRPRGGRVSAGSGRVIGSVREEESFGKFEIQPEPEPEAAAGPRGQAMFPSVFDGPEAAAPRSPGTILKATQVIPPPSHFLDHISPIFPPFPPFFAHFHRLDDTVPTSPKPERMSEKQWQRVAVSG